jgi:glutathione peroxidase
MSVYDFKVTDMSGAEVSLKDYEGKVLLIVNTATLCGFTPQYGGLQDIYAKLNEKGFEILDFPCNQFANQAPGTEEEIHTFCTGRFGITFRQFGKVEVNGDNASSLYKYLTGNTHFAGFDKEHELSPILDKMLSEADPDYKHKPDIKWNFTKFLIDRQGNIVKRFEPTVDLAVVEKAVAELL